MFTDQLLPQGTILISPVEILARFHKVCPRTCITLIKKQQQPNSKTTIKTRCKINKPLPSITNPFDPLQTSSLYYKPLPSITNLFPPLQTSSLHYKPLPSVSDFVQKSLTEICQNLYCGNRGKDENLLNIWRQQPRIYSKLSQTCIVEKKHYIARVRF